MDHENPAAGPVPDFMRIAFAAFPKLEGAPFSVSITEPGSDLDLCLGEGPEAVRIVYDPLGAAVPDDVAAAYIVRSEEELRAVLDFAAENRGAYAKEGPAESEDMADLIFGPLE